MLGDADYYGIAVGQKEDIREQNRAFCSETCIEHLCYDTAAFCPNLFVILSCKKKKKKNSLFSHTTRRV